MQLFIAEKPSLGRAIAEVIGTKAKRNGYIECKNDTVVTWCFGHILELAKPDYYIGSKEAKPRWKQEDLPIIPKQWKRLVKKDAKRQFDIIKSLTNKADVVINTGDPDREGQLLVDEVLEYLRVKKPVKRIWLQALDRENILKALRNLKDNKEYLPYKLSAEARSYADWLVGMNFTRYFTLKANTLITVGRVQTPTLALVVKRDEQIENFKPHDYFMLYANFDGFRAVFQVPEDLDGTDEENRIISKTVVEKIVDQTSKKYAVVKQYLKKRKKENPPLPYMLSSLQRTMNEKYGLTAQQVLSIAQTLYEKKLTTYPRTDCPYVAEEQHKDAKKILSNLAYIVGNEIVSTADLSIKHYAFDNSKLTAHTAIIPTGDTANYNSLSDIEKKVYKDIALAYACLFHKPYEYYGITTELDIEGYKFKAEGKEIIDLGFKKYCGKKENEKIIPPLKQSDKILNKQTTIEIKQTKPPARFTDGSLVSAMSHIHKYIDDKQAKAILKENDGIGTEATRAAIIEQLIKRGYLQRKGKQIISTPLARDFIKQLPDFIKDPVLTAKWERGLSGIENKEISFDKFLNAQIDFIKKKLADDTPQIKLTSNNPKAQGQGKKSSKQTKKKCPECGNPLLRLKTKTKKDYYFCPSCKSAYWVEKGGKVGKKWNFK